MVYGTHIFKFLMTGLISELVRVAPEWVPSMSDAWSGSLPYTSYPAPINF